jgi:hypothetical protein
MPAPVAAPAPPTVSPLEAQVPVKPVSSPAAIIPTAQVIPSVVEEAVIAAAGARISAQHQSDHELPAKESVAAAPPSVAPPPVSPPPPKPEPQKPPEAAGLEASTLDLTTPEGLGHGSPKPQSAAWPEPGGELLLDDSMVHKGAADEEPQAVSVISEAAPEFELTASAVDVAQILEVEADLDSAGEEPRTQTLVQTSPLETSPLETSGPSQAEDSLAQAFEESQVSFGSQAGALAEKEAAPKAEPILAAKPMSILEGRGGVLKASQTQMSTPIQIDHTQLPRVMKQAATAAQTAGTSQVTVTVQELDATYQKNIFLNSLEIVYYKLLRAAFTQFLIFPKVTSRAAVTVISKNPDHLKVAENVLTNTTISFVVCDVKLNIRAVVEIVDDKEPPTNKDRARDYILKKAGLMIVRFYSGDTPPDVSTLRKLLTD